MPMTVSITSQHRRIWAPCGGPLKRRNIILVILIACAVSVSWLGRMLIATTKSTATTHHSQHEFLTHSDLMLPITKRISANRSKDRHFTPYHLPKFLKYPFDFLGNATTVKQILRQSHVASLDHCKLEPTNWTHFTTWALPIVQDTTREIIKHKDYSYIFPNTTIETQMPQEMILELLEMYATHKGYCDFTNFYPTVPAMSNIESKLRQISEISHPLEFARLAIVIVAFQDVHHLKRLVDALYMPQHYIVIHLEEQTDSEFERMVYKEIVGQYDNVVVVKFGTVAYKSDSVSMINLKIMTWLVHDLHLQYDFHIAIGGAVFPLYSAKDLSRHLKASNRSVWLGQLTNAGFLGDNVTSHDARLQQKRLYYTLVTSSKVMKRVSNRLVRSHGFDPIIPSDISQAMVFKTNSGNQAVYSYDTVRSLVSSPRVKELFALAKYGCCCCIEERSWIAALSLIGLQEEALQHAAMFQVWGGQETCGSSMNNAILHENETSCFLLEDAAAGSNRTRDTPLYFRGNEIMSRLQQAKQRGFLFARKFRSNHPGSMALLSEIEEQLHQIRNPHSLTYE